MKHGAAAAVTALPARPADSPFDPENRDAYLRWRERKLRGYPRSAGDLVVEIRDPGWLTGSEREAMLALCRKTNMALYAGPARGEDRGEDTALPRRLGRQFGLERLDCNWLADEDGISRLTVCEAGQRGEFIPYTDRAIKWHTDGYYNPPQRRIRAMVLHCVRDAAQGGDNALLDHEIAYMLLRDADPDHVRALMAPDAMTIPARLDETGIARSAATGPVFSVDPINGHLHMRYTARTQSIEWKPDSATRAAVAFLQHLLASDSPFIFRTRLTPGVGLICNNVLHDRSGFTDDASRPRLLYRARYLDRIDTDGIGRPG